jgi:superfamily II DNA or RNA helicase
MELVCSHLLDKCPKFQATLGIEKFYLFRFLMSIRQSWNKLNTVELTEALFAKMAGWEAMKSARAMLSAGRVVSSSWESPHLRGVVQQASGTIKSGLVIRSVSDADNLCPCRESRERGLICAHSIAVGLHFLNPSQQTPAKAEPVVKAKAVPEKKVFKRILRVVEDSTCEGLELRIIFPPNLTEAAVRGKIMVYCEGRWGRGTAPLNAVPMDTKFSLSKQDGAILDALEALGDGDTPAMLMLDTAKLGTLLCKLVGHPGLSIGKNQAVAVEEKPSAVMIVARLLDKGGISLRLGNVLDGQLLTGGEKIWLLSGANFCPVEFPQTMASLFQGPVVISRSEVPRFLNSEWPGIVAKCEVDTDFSPEDFEFSLAQPQFKLQLSGGLAILEARLECFYGEKAVSSTSSTSIPETLWIEDSAFPHRYQTRDMAAETNALEILRRNGFTGPDTKGVFHLKGQEPVLRFFARDFQRLEKEWDVTMEARLEQSTQKNLERIRPQVHFTASGEEWFDLSVVYSTDGGERFSAADIQSILRSGQNHKRMASGKIALLDTEAVEEFREILVDCQPEQKEGVYRMRNNQAGFVQSTIARNTDWQVEASKVWRQKVGFNTGIVELAAPVLGALEEVLRPYQKHGVAWLAFLKENSFGGVLADEMGLGKTLQVLGFLQSLKVSGNLNVHKPSLVVCPTSLVMNWCAESAKFTPGLKTLAIQGIDRKKLFADIAEADLVITSYALMRRDMEQYRGMEFENIILDEAQHIKNRQSQNAQSVKMLRSRNRIVLTGTPIENSVLDLWSIFDFLMPGYLGTAADFKERYEVLITREKNPVAQDRLNRRLRPFILRRLKKDVAAELPEKIEQVSFCEMSEEQRALYSQVLDASRKEILAKTGTGTEQQSRMFMLTALLRLRQICCDPRLLKLGDTSPPGSLPSGKFEMFTELLEEIIDGGHRVLVFSQFTSMLGLLREYLDTEKIAYCYLDGSTKKRSEVVEKFQRQGGIPVFLISLKAGGTGLNLTGADTVIHFDPWWNPAVEAQATDRAHRIGQKRVVTSYKLITRGTVEEKIMNLQNRKKSLLEGVFGEEEGFVKSLDWTEIRELLAD